MGNHIKQHNSQKGKGKDGGISATIAEKITTFQTIVRPYIIPAIPIFLIVVMILVFIIWRCCRRHKTKEVTVSAISSSVSPSSSGTAISQVIAKDLGYTELKEM